MTIYWVNDDLIFFLPLHRKNFLCLINKFFVFCIKWNILIICVYFLKPSLISTNLCLISICDRVFNKLDFICLPSFILPYLIYIFSRLIPTNFEFYARKLTITVIVPIVRQLSIRVLSRNAYHSSTDTRTI